jgi:hypothetical protein
MELNNCYYVLLLTRTIIFASCLMNDDTNYLCVNLLRLQVQSDIANVFSSQRCLKGLY